MRIIISPAKQMRVDTDSFGCKELPVFMDRTEVLMKWIQSLSYEEQKKLWVCNDKIAWQNAERFAHMDLRKNLTPAILAYDGIQYTYMAPAVFEDGQYDYVQEHLRILSGFYGVVRPMDGVVPYRLECRQRLPFPVIRTFMTFGATASIGKWPIAVESSSILLRKSTQSALRNIFSRRTGTSLVSLVNWKVIRLFKRVSMPRW